MPSSDTLHLDGGDLTVHELAHAARVHQPMAVSDRAKEAMAASRKVLEDLVDQDRVIYGVNTSLGGFVNWLVPTKFAETLQQNLLSAVATNMGPSLGDEAVRATMIARNLDLTRLWPGLKMTPPSAQEARTGKKEQSCPSSRSIRSKQVETSTTSLG